MSSAEFVFLMKWKTSRETSSLCVRPRNTQGVLPNVRVFKPNCFPILCKYSISDVNYGARGLRTDARSWSYDVFRGPVCMGERPRRRQSRAAIPRYGTPLLPFARPSASRSFCEQNVPVGVSCDRQSFCSRRKKERRSLSDEARGRPSGCLRPHGGRPAERGLITRIQ